MKSIQPILINEKNLDTCVVDPGDAKPVLEYINKNNLNLRYILNTHHHGDHIGGNNILKSKFDAKILAFEDDKDRIPMVDIPLKDNQIWKDGIRVDKLEGAEPKKLRKLVAKYESLLYARVGPRRVCACFSFRRRARAP